MQDWKLALVVGGVALGGVVVGAQCFGARPAAAQTTTGYTRCMAVHQPSLDVDDHGTMQRPDDAHAVLVPAGWEPVGGGGIGNTWDGMLWLCRR